MNACTDVQLCAIVDPIIARYATEPVDLLKIGDANREYRYLIGQRDGYVRTIQDILAHFGDGDHRSIKVLEIGAFLGVVSIALSQIGFQVTVTDIEEYIACANLRRRFDDCHIKYAASNLRDYSLPFRDEEFDAVIMCETIEHLNFNPLPVIQEINRVTKQNGLLYLTCPNLASAANRTQLLQGKSIHSPIDAFFAQLDPDRNMIVGLHWREYTADEIREMLQKLGFGRVVQKYDVPVQLRNRREYMIRKFVHAVINLPFLRGVIYASLFDPDDLSLNDRQIALAVKTNISKQHFYFTDATLPDPETKQIG